MRRVVLLLSAVAILLASGRPQAQDIPDFSGKWTAVVAKPTGREVFALGDTFTVIQIDTILQLDAAGSKRTLIIDGLPHEHRATQSLAASAAAAPAAPRTAVPAKGEPTRSVTTARATSTVTWQDEMLRIVTVEVVTVSQPTKTPDRIDTRTTTTLTWRLLPDGQLSVGRTIVADPPSPGRPPAPVKTTYTRSK